MRPSGHGQQPLAVFDFGKTNAKMFVFAPDLAILDQQRCTPVWAAATLGRDACRVLDSDHLWEWMNTALACALQRWPLGGVMISGHGCAAALLAGGRLQRPILDYESETPAAVNAAYAGAAPDFEETQTPHLPAGLNLGRQLFWIEAREPERFARTEAILSLPQFWAWQLGGRPATEVSSLGCHSHLWSPRGRDFSSMAQARGWRARFPPFERAGAVLGTCHVSAADGGAEGNAAVALRVHNGVHDSNAALHYYRSLGHDDCTVVSTGTWVIVFNPGCPLQDLDPARDMLANVTIDGQPIATARFMGGREFDLITQGARCAADEQAVAAAIRREQFALPSFAPGGPFPGQAGRVIGPPAGSDLERVAIGALYLACMTSAVLQLVRSTGPVIVDGGLAYNAAYLGLLAQLRGSQQVLRNPMAEGSAAGAAAIAYEALGHRPKLAPCAAVTSWQVAGLAAYEARWRALAEAPASRRAEA
jgi:sugar (pentulose or hexulose) kinase